MSLTLGSSRNVSPTMLFNKGPVILRSFISIEMRSLYVIASIHFLQRLNYFIAGAYTCGCILCFYINQQVNPFGLGIYIFLGQQILLLAYSHRYGFPCLE